MRFNPFADTWRTGRLRPNLSAREASLDATKINLFFVKLDAAVLAPLLKVGSQVYAVFLGT